MDAITYDIDIEHAERFTTCLVLDPEERRLYTYSYIGNYVTTGEEFHNLHMGITKINHQVSGEALQGWLEDNEAAIDAIIEQYDGSEWNGSNHVGRWGEDAHNMAAQLGDDITAAVTDETISRYWDARSWMDGAWSDTIDDVRESDDLDALAQDYVDQGSINGQLLRLDDVRAVLDEAAEEIANEDDED